MLDEIKAIDDEETKELLVSLHRSLLAKHGLLSMIAEKCGTVDEFRNRVNKWLDDTTVEVSESDIERAWESKL